jgi:hypothetical protein
LKLLRLQPDATKALRGDIGVIIGNAVETTARAEPTPDFVGSSVPRPSIWPLKKSRMKKY